MARTTYEQKLEARVTELEATLKALRDTQSAEMVDARSEIVRLQQADDSIRALREIIERPTAAVQNSWLIQELRAALTGSTPTPESVKS